VKTSHDVVKKALTDPAFKAELLKNPGAAVEAALGIKVPPGVAIKVVEDSASTVHLVLPRVPAKGELGEKDLDKVSGGAAPPQMSPTKGGYCDSTASYPCL
jgi:hypothetical protein